MSKMIAGLACALLATAVPAFAASPFDGTWKGDLASAKLPSKPDMFGIRDGVYTCSTCTPAVTVPADGMAHAVKGHDYFDSMTVKVVGPREVAYTYRRAGKVTTTSVDSVSPDGKLLTSRFDSMDNAKGLPVHGSSTAVRVGPAPAGAHAMSGAWRANKVTDASDANLMLTYHVTGRTLHMTTGTGEHYAAIFGGPFVPVVGDPGKTMVAVKLTGPRSFVETDRRGGKPVATYANVVAPDGRTIRITYNDLRNHTATTFTAHKQ